MIDAYVSWLIRLKWIESKKVNWKVIFKADLSFLERVDDYVYILSPVIWTPVTILYHDKS